MFILLYRNTGLMFILDFLPSYEYGRLHVIGVHLVKRLGCNSDSLLQIEHSCQAIRAIVNLSSLGDMHLGSTKNNGLSCSLVN